MMIARCTALLLFYVAVVVSQQHPLDPVEIQVLNDLTGVPLSGTNVVITNESGQESGKTDGRGRFAGHCDPAKSCLVRVTRKGFAMPRGSGTGIFFDANKVSNNVLTVRMNPQAVITGRVLDQYGDPVRHALVHVEDKYFRTGIGTFYQGGSSSLTDDLGIFRISDISPGKHYLAFEYDSEREESAVPTLRQRRFKWPSLQGFVLYPNAADTDHAQVVETGEGSLVKLSDIRMKIGPPVRISGQGEIA